MKQYMKALATIALVNGLQGADAPRAAFSTYQEEYMFPEVEGKGLPEVVVWGREEVASCEDLIRDYEHGGMPSLRGMLYACFSPKFGAELRRIANETARFTSYIRAEKQFANDLVVATFLGAVMADLRERRLIKAPIVSIITGAASQPAGGADVIAQSDEVSQPVKTE